MDFHSLKRKDLQALCKKHGIPANLTNREMADRLASNFKESEDHVSSEELSTSPVEICLSEAKVVKKQSKKVRFSPESDNQTFEYEVSVYQKPKRARRKTLSKNPARVPENAPKSEDIKKLEGCQLRVTRSRVQNAVEEDMSTVSSPPFGRKRGRGGKKSKDAKEVEDIGDSESFGNIDNGDGLSGRKLRCRKNMTQGDAKKIKNVKGGDEFHLLDECSEVKDDPKQSTSNVEVVSRVTRQSRAQFKGVASMVSNEFKIVGVKKGCEADKPVRRSKRYSGKDCAKSATSAKTETQVTKAQEQSERDIALPEPPECLRRYPSRKKSVVSQSGMGANEEELLKEETKKRSRNTELDAIVEDGSEVERAKNDVTSQHKAPSRRGRRKTVIVTAPASELANKKDIAVTSQQQAPSRRGRRKTVIFTAPASELAKQEDIGKGTTEEPRKSSRNTSRYSLSGTSKQDPIAVNETDQRVKHQTQEPILEEEKTSASKHHPPAQKPQRGSSRNTSISASVAPPTPTANGVEKEKQNKSTMAIVEDEAAAPTESLPSPRELPAEKDVLVTVSERAGNEKNLELDVSVQLVKNGDTFSNKSKEGLRRNSGAKKQRGFAEASPLFLIMEKCQDPAENMEETRTASHVKLVGPSTEQETNQSAPKSVAIYDKERNLIEDDKEKMVNDGDIESEVCMSSQTVNTTSVFDDVNLQVSKHLKCESKGGYSVDSSQITFPAESHAENAVIIAGSGLSDQEMKEDMKLMDTHSTHESLIVYKEDITLVESEKEMLVQVDAAGSEMNHHSSSWSLTQRGAVSNVINMDEVTCRANDLSDKKDLTGATSTFLQSEEELGTELSGGENTYFASDNLTAADREARIAVELKDNVVIAGESVKEEVLNLNKSGETSGFKGELEITLMKAEEIIATDVSNKEGIPQIESSVEAAENQESSAKSHFVNQKSSYSNTVAPGTQCEPPAPENQFENKCRAEAAGTARRKMFDRERIEDPDPGNAPCSHESVLMYEENTGLVKTDEEIRIHDDYFESESSPSLTRRCAVEDSNLVSPEIVSLSDIFSSASQVDHAGKSSSHMELEKVLETQEPSENVKTINYNMDAEGIRTSVPEDQERSEDPDSGNAPCIHESVFMHEENTTTLVKNNEEITIPDDYFESESSPSLNRTSVVSPEIVSLADIFSSASQVDHAGKSSSHVELEKVLETQEPSEKVKAINYNMDAEGIRTSVPEDQEMSEDPDSGNAPCIHESVFMYEENTTTLVKNNEEIRIHGDHFESESSPSLNRTGVDSPEIVSLADIFSSASQVDHVGKSSSHMELEKVLETQEPSENVKAINYNMDAEGIRTSVPEDQERSEDPDSGNAPCIHESVFMYEENTTTLVKNNEEIRIHGDHFESESSPSLNRTGVDSHEIVPLVDIFSSASQGDHAGKTSSRVELEKVSETQEPSENFKSISYNIDAEGIRTSVPEDQERSEDPDPGNAPCIHESVFMSEENTTRLVKNNEETRIPDDYFESESSPSLNRTSVVSPEIVSLVDIFSSASQGDHAGKTPSRMELDKVSETQELSENLKSISYNMDTERIRSPVPEDQVKGKLENANVFIAESVEEVIFNDLLDELGESIGLKSGSEIPFKTSEKLTTTKIDVAAITSTPNTTKMKCILSSDTAPRGTSVGLAAKSQDKFCSRGIAASITGSEICSQDMEISLVEDEKEKLLQDDTIKSKMKSQPFLSNKTCSLDDAWVEVASNPNKMVSSGMTYLGDVCSLANQTNFPGETSNELKPEKLLDIEESSWTENVNYRRYKIEVKEDKNVAQEGLSSMHLEDTNITAAEPVQGIVSLYPLEVCQSGDTKESEISLRKAEETGTEGSSGIGMVQTNRSIETNEISEVKEDTGLAQEDQSSMQLEDTNITHSQLDQEVVVFLDHLNKVCVSGGTKEFEVSLKKAELTVTDDSFGKGMVQTESSVGNNEMNEATGQKTIMAMQWSQDFQGTIYRVETDVTNAGYAMPGQLINEENVKIVENEERINTEKEFYLSRKKETIDQRSERKFVANGVFDPLSENNSQCAKDKRLDFSDEGTDHVSPDEKGICNEKLPYGSCLPAINDKQEKSEAVCMDVKNTGIEFPVNILPQLALEQLDNESETQKQGAEGGEVKAEAFTHALPPEDLTAPTTSESYSMSPLDHTPMDGETNASGERVMDHPLSKDFVATMDGNGIIEGGETDGVEEDNIVEEIASAPKLELTGYSSGEVDAELYDTDMSGTKTIEKEHPQAMDDISNVGGTEISTECKEHKHLDESTFFTNLEMKLFWGDEDEIKETDAKAGDSNDVDNGITECNSSGFKEGDYVAITEAEDTNFSVKKCGPEDTEETVELRLDFSRQGAAMADKSPLLKSSEIDRVVDGEAAPAFRTELNLINMSAKKETSNSVTVKQLISSIMKSKNNSGLIQKTPKRHIFHDMKENEGGSTKMVEMGNKTTPKTLSKLRRPLDRL